MKTERGGERVVTVWCSVRENRNGEMGKESGKVKRKAGGEVTAEIDSGTNKKVKTGDKKERGVTESRKFVLNGFGEKINEVEPKRDARGNLIFKDFPKFRPSLTPKQVIQAGSFGGCYFHPRGGKPGIINPKKGVDINHKEFPVHWFEGLRQDQYAGRRYKTKEINKYGVKAGQPQAEWERMGWIHQQDPRGWFHWYCRFYLGRRSDDDNRQVSRWIGVCGAKGRWKQRIANMCAVKAIAKREKKKAGTEVGDGNGHDDESISPVIRQTLLHWAYILTERDVSDAMKKMYG